MNKKRIVVIEDNEADAFVLGEAIAAAGVNCELVRIEDAEQARNYIVAGGKQPDLFVVDLNLPRIDGIGILKLIREQQPLAGVPIMA